MSSPDFYFAVNAIARHILDEYGKDVLIDYWQSLGREYYTARADQWRKGGAVALAEDWREYFLNEPNAEVETTVDGGSVELDIKTCPAIKHLRDSGRDILPCYCEHCDHTCGAMAEAAGYRFERTGGMGVCTQRFVPITHTNSEVD
jgi:hypothetical protein